MATKTVFQAGAVPQSLYNLTGTLANNQNYIQSLFSQPTGITNWALQAAAAIPGQNQTYATNLPLSQMGGNPYYQQASNYWTQLGDIGQSLVSQGINQNLSGWGDILMGQGMGTQGQQVFTQGQQMIPGGEQLIGQGQGLVGYGSSMIPGGYQLIGEGQSLVGQGAGVFESGIQDLQNIVSQYPQIEAQLSQLPSYQAIMSTGLTPEQQAYVTQATQAQQAAVTQQLQTEGLGSSTMMAEKLGAAQQAGAATAGSLIQGNIQAATQAANAAANAVQERINQEQQGIAVGQNLLSGGAALGGLGISQEGQGIGMLNAATGVMGAGTNLINAGTGYVNAAGGIMSAGTGMTTAGANWANVGQSEQSLGLNSQSTGANYINTVATANVGMQQQLYSEAMQGYGVLGQFLNDQLTSYGLSLQGEQIKGSESAASAQTSAALKEAQASADAQGFSGLLSSIGSLLGGGKEGGGIFGAGGIGSLFGGGAGAAAGFSGTLTGAGAVGATAGAGAAGAGGLGAALGSALTVAGALFCAVGREIFGTENPEWYLMRDVMLFRAPKWLRKAYIRHARDWAAYLSTRPLLKRLVRLIVRRIVQTLTHAESGIFTIK